MLACLGSFALLFHFLCGNYVNAQFQARPAMLRYSTLSVEDGLSQSSVRCFLQDRRGFIWIGTGDGLNRYDGHTFRVFHHDPQDTSSLSDDNINAVDEESDGTLWIGTYKGLHRYDERTGTFARPVGVTPASHASLSSIITRIWVENDLLGINTATDIRLFHPRSGKVDSPIVVPPAGISPVLLMKDNAGTVWFAVGDKLLRYDPERQTLLEVAIPAEFRGTITCGIRDKTGASWFGTINSGLIKCDALTGRWQRFLISRSARSSAFRNVISALQEDNFGRLWVGTRGDGLLLFDRGSDTFAPVIPSSSGNVVARLYLDRSDMLWVGYDGSGVAKVNTKPDKFRHVLLPPTSRYGAGDNFIKPLLAGRDGAIWIGTYDRGLARFDLDKGLVKRYSSRPSSESLSSNSIVSLLEDRTGALWVGTMNGITRLMRDGKTVTRYPTSSATDRFLLASIVLTLCQDSSGTIWAGTATRLLRFNPSSNRMISVAGTGDTNLTDLNSRIETLTAAGDSVLWVGTRGLGLIRYDIKRSKLDRWRSAPTDPNSLSHDVVKAISVESDSILWLGTESGLNRLNWRTRTIRRYHERDGLPNDFVYGIVPDQQGRLWISTNNGISMMNASNPARPAFRNYTPDDGLQSFEFNTNSYCATANGYLLFGGVNGFNVFHPDSVFDNPVVPNVVITGFKKFDQPFDVGGELFAKQKIALRYSESVFSFEFAALEFTNEKKNQYAYRMKGFDKEWIFSGRRHEARYTNLDPGEYTFQVKGSNNDGVWNEHAGAVRVVIVPPFWKTGWFIAVVSVLGVGAVAGGARYVSTRKLRKQIEQLEREKAVHEARLRTRERIARDLHDDLASTVGSASFFVESVKTTLRDAPQQAKEFLDKIGSLLSEAEDSMSDIVWSVSPHHDTLESMLARIRLTASDLCKANNIKHEVSFPEGVAHYKLADELRRGVYLIFKESLTNAVRHSGASVIRVEGRIGGDHFELRVVDNGRGMSTAEKPEGSTKRGHGLRNMKKRAEEIGALFSMESTPDQGTSVKLTVRMTQSGH